MDYQYTVVRETHDDGRKSYGIAVVVRYEDDTISTMRTLSDICADEQRVRQLVRLCNELKLDPLHFNEVAEDFLGES